MAENFEKKVLIGIEVKAKDALKEYAELKIKVDGLKEAQSELKRKMLDVDTSTAESKQRLVNLRQEYEFVGQQIKAYNKEAQNYQKEIQSNIRMEAEQETSLQRLKAQLSLDTAAFNKLTEAQRNANKGQELSKRIQDTTAKLKEEEKALGNHRREVGNYALAGKELKDELKNITYRMIELASEGKKDSEEFKEISKRAGELKDAIMDVNAEIKAQASDTAALDGLVQTVGLATAAYSAWKGATQALGIKNEALEETMQKMQVATNALVAIQQIQNTVQSQSAASILAKNILQKIGLTQDRQQAVSTALNTTATNLQTKAEQKGVISKLAYGAAAKVVTGVQWLWNAAVSANPLGILVITILAAITAITVFTKWLSASAQAQREAEKTSKAYELQQQKTAATLDDINNREKNISNERNNRLRQEVIEMKKNGATATEIANVQAKGAQDIRDIEIQAAKDREAANRALWKSAKNNIDAQRAYLHTLGKGTEKYREQLKVVNDLVIANNQLAQTVKDDQQKQIDLNLKSAEAGQEAADSKKKKYQDTATKMLDLQKKFQDEQNKLIDTGAKRDFLSQQRRDEDLFEQNQKYERDKLDMQRKFQTITKAEYEKQNQILSTQNQTFYQKQVADANAYYKQQRDNVFKLIRQSVTAQIDEINNQYSEALKTLNTEVPEPKQKEGQSDKDYQKELSDYRDFMLNRVAYAADLEREQTKKIEEIRKSDFEKQLQDFERNLQTQYGAGLAAFTDNEAEKNRVETEMEQKRSNAAMDILEKEFEKRRLEIARNAEALADTGGFGVDEKTMQAYNDLEAEYNRRKNEQIAKDNAAARALESQAIQLQLNRELIAAGDNVDAQYKAKKQALEKELQLYQGNADKQAEIQRNLANLEREIMKERIAKFEEWSGRTMDILGAMNDLASANEEADLQRYQETNDQKKESLQQRLDSGLISQEEYDAGVAAADAELDKKQKEIARDQAIREKALSAFDIAINTAVAIMKNTAQLGLVPAIPVNIATGILGAIQLAAVLAKPLPKAERGALLKGASHAAGGIMIEAEGGEAIINKRSTAMFAPLLSAINQAGGGIPFSSAYSDGGYRVRTINNTYGGLSEKQIERAMEKAIGKQKVYLTVEDYRRADANYIEINDLSDNE